MGAGSEPSRWGGPVRSPAPRLDAQWASRPSVPTPPCSLQSRDSARMEAQPTTIPVREAHRFDERALVAYLERHLPAFRAPCSIRQFEGGQSNPTFLVETNDERLVLRKKPPGRLLPSAHAVEREFRVMQALRESDVPVSSMLLLCEDADVIGTPFIVMEHVAGRVFHDPTLPGLRPQDRAGVYAHMNEILVALHRIEPEEIGLADFGRSGNYYQRQVSRWSRQYQASETRPIASMDRLVDWLPRNVPSSDEACIVHGDYRLGNMILHPTRPRIAAVLDWELSTLGHPLADLSYNLMSYYLPSRRNQTLVGNDPAVSGIPSCQDQLESYCRLSGRDAIQHWNFYLSFSMFRSAAIGQGVYKRGLDGNASSATALELGREVESTADIAWAAANGEL